MDGPADRPRDPRRRTGSAGARRVEPSGGSRQSRHDCQESRGDVAGRLVIRPPARSDAVRRVSPTDRGMRPGLATASQGLRRQAGRPDGHDQPHFPSWLGLWPDNRITGGKVIRRGPRHVINRAATALRIAATTLLRSQSYLGAQYRRFRSKLGAPKAITAMAHKLAVLVYRMLRWGHEYVDKGLQYYEERHREQQIRQLKKRAAKLGLLVV